MCTCRDSKRERISDAVFTLVQHGGKGPEKYLPQGFSQSWHTFVPKLVKLLLRNHVAFNHVQSTHSYSEISTLECFFFCFFNLMREREEDSCLEICKRLKVLLILGYENPLIMQRSVRTYCDHEGTVKNIICEFRTEKNPNALSHSQVLFDQFLKYITNYDKGIMTLKN